MYKHGYKYQKLYHNPSPFSWEREGSLTAKSPNPSFKIWYDLTVHIIHFKIFTGKIFQIWGFSGKIQAKSAQFVYILCMSQAPAPAENFQKFQRIMQIPHSSPT